LIFLENLTIPKNMRVTLNGLEFLVRDSTINDRRVLMFITIANIIHLA
ncbi:11976_t:CDS:1, partial [Funneliformis mosseae]